MNELNCFCFGHIINILLTKLSRSVWENLDLGRVYRPHYVRFVLTTSVKILPYRPPARLIRAKYWLVFLRNFERLNYKEKLRRLKFSSKNMVSQCSRTFDKTHQENLISKRRKFFLKIRTDKYINEKKLLEHREINFRHF